MIAIKQSDRSITINDASVLVLLRYVQKKVGIKIRTSESDFTRIDTGDC